MTQTLAGADIRGYYAALGIQIPGWARTEASVRCFADPDAHRRGDRDPSCSVNLEHGAWHCHACGASGGAFDAATKRGYSDREAIDLMVAYRLTEHRTYRLDHDRRSRRASTPTRQASAKPTRLSASITEDAIATWQRRARRGDRPDRASSPATAAGSTPRCWSSALESTADGSRSPSATTNVSSSACFATSPGRTPASPRCSPPPARAERCCRTPPPNPPHESCSSRANQT